MFNPETDSTPAPRPAPRPEARVLIVEPQPELGHLYAETIRTHVPGAAPLVRTPQDESLCQDVRLTDVIICSAGETRRTRFQDLEQLSLMHPEGRIVLLAPAHAVECVEAAFELGAQDVLLKSVGYLEQLPVTIRKNILQARSWAAREASLRDLTSSLDGIRQENQTLMDLVVRLKALAMTDPLTELANRRGIELRLDECVATAKRHGSDLSVLMIDLDGLKSVNDVLGHQAGDDLLRTAADCIRRQCRRGDIAGRAGGDEFIIILPHADAGRAAKVAERLRLQFQSLIAPVQKSLDDTRRALGVIHVINRGSRSDLNLPLGLTVGVASLATAGTTTSTGLIARADEALYSGKRAGKGRVSVYGADIGLARAG